MGATPTTRPAVLGNWIHLDKQSLRNPAKPHANGAQNWQKLPRASKFIGCESFEREENRSIPQVDETLGTDRRTLPERRELKQWGASRRSLRRHDPQSAAAPAGLRDFSGYSNCVAVEDWISDESRSDRLTGAPPACGALYVDRYAKQVRERLPDGTPPLRIAAQQMSGPGGQ